MLSIENLSAGYGRSCILQGLTFSVPAGQAVALWGPNGAGKTTLLRCLLGLLRFEGAIRIGGVDIRHAGSATRRLIGYVPQELALYDELCVAESLVFFARLKQTGVDVGRSLASVGLEGKGGLRVNQLSGGMKQRLALAIAALTDPPLLVLDEPTSNLDSAARADLLARLRGLHAAGKTILLVSHRPEEVDGLATRVLTVEAGRLVADHPWPRASFEAPVEETPIASSRLFPA